MRIPEQRRTNSPIDSLCQTETYRLERNEKNKLMVIIEKANHQMTNKPHWIWQYESFAAQISGEVIQKASKDFWNDDENWRHFNYS